MKSNVTTSLVRFIAVSVFAAIATTAKAQVGVSDISATRANGTIYKSAGLLLAQSFTTDNSAAQFSLSSASFMSYQNTGTITDFTMTIRSDSGSSPGSILGTLTGSTTFTADPSGKQYDFSTGSSVLLSPSTTYWLVWGFSNPVDSGATYFGTAVADTASTGQWSLGANKASFDAGATWPSAANSSFALQVSVQASAIPEPSTYAAILAGVSLLGAGTYRRRQRRVLA